MDLLQWLQNTPAGEFLFTVLVSMVPVVELRGGLPFGVALGLPHWAALAASILGNLIPLPFIVVYIRRVFHWIRRRIPRLDGMIEKLETKAHLKGGKVTKYKYLGLMIFVAIPLPGTGGWTGALVAAFLDMPLRKALPSIICGVCIAGLIVFSITYGVTSVFSAAAAV